MSDPKYTILQYYTDRALLDGLDPIVKRYLTNEGWGPNDIKKLAYALKFWREAIRSKDERNREVCMQNFLAALSAHKGLKIMMPNRLSISKDGDTASFIEDKELRKRMGRDLFRSDDFKNFKFEIKTHNVQLGDINGCDYAVKHICPKGIVILFENRLSYLVERTTLKTNMFFQNPSTNKHRTRKIKNLEIEWNNEGKVSIWDKVSIKSVARPVHRDETTNVYVSSPKIMYVELKLENRKVEEAFEQAGGEGKLKITSQSNLKHYVPKQRWEQFEVDIENARDAFDTEKTELLNEGSEETKQKSRNAIDLLNQYFGNSKMPAFEDYEEPEEVGTRAADGERRADVDTDMSGVGEEEL